MSSELCGQRVLVVQRQPPKALAFGATVARCGGLVTVARTRGAALVEIERTQQGFDAALVDVSLSGNGLDDIVMALRNGERPCLAVGLCGSVDAEKRRAVTAGVVDLVTSPCSPEELVGALIRCAGVTATLRARLAEEEIPPNVIKLPRRSPHGVVANQRVLVDPARSRRSDLEGRVTTFGRRRGLSKRERSVLRFIAMGYRYEEIGEALAISPRTVKMHASNIRKKVGVTDRYQLVRKMYA